MNKKYQKISEEIMHQNPWWVYKHDVYKCDEKQCDYYYGETNGGVAVVPILDDGRIVLVRQYRYLRDRHGVEFVGGAIRLGETALQSAMRELKEETGFESSNFSKLSEFEPCRGILKDTIHVFLANEIIDQKNLNHLDTSDTEDIEIIFRRPSEIEQMIRNGEIWDGETMATWTLVRDIINVNKI